MYIVKKDSLQREYKVKTPSEALLLFKNENSLENLEGVFIRPYGGVEVPAITLWPRLRK